MTLDAQFYQMTKEAVVRMRRAPFASNTAGRPWGLRTRAAIGQGLDNAVDFTRRNPIATATAGGAGLAGLGTGYMLSGGGGAGGGGAGVDTAPAPQLENIPEALRGMNTEGYSQEDMDYLHNRFNNPISSLWGDFTQGETEQQAALREAASQRIGDKATLMQRWNLMNPQMRMLLTSLLLGGGLGLGGALLSNMGGR